MTSSRTSVQASPLLHYSVRGQGPVVVLLHGFLASSEYWNKVVHVTEADHTIITVDLLGFGKSPKPRKSRYDYDAHISSIETTLRHLGVTKPFTMVGHSMGALLALRYARLHQQAVSKLVLVNMPVMLGRREVREEIISKNFAHKYGLQPFTHRIVWATFKTLFRLRLLSKRSVRMLKQNRYFFEHSPLSRMRSFQRVISEARADIDLNLVRVQTLVLSGLEDRKIYMDNLQRNISLSPTVVLESLPTGHHIPWIMPAMLAQKLRN